MVDQNRPKNRGGGRPKGAKNKATRERERKEELEKQAILDAFKGRVSKVIAEATEQARNGGSEIRPLAKDEISGMVSVIKGIVSRFQVAAVGPNEEGAPDRKGFDAGSWRRLMEWFKFYLEVCKAAAEYESPKVRPIELSAGAAAAKEAEESGERELRIIVEGGLPEPDEITDHDSERAIQAEIDALKALKEEARRKREAKGDGQAG